MTLNETLFLELHRGNRFSSSAKTEPVIPNSTITEADSVFGKLADCHEEVIRNDEDLRTWLDIFQMAVKDFGRQKGLDVKTLFPVGDTSYIYAIDITSGPDKPMEVAKMKEFIFSIYTQVESFMKKQGLTDAVNMNYTFNAYPGAGLPCNEVIWKVLKFYRL